MLPVNKALTPSASDTDKVNLWELLSALPVPAVAYELRAENLARYVNPSFTRDFGYTIEDMPNLSAWTTLAYPDPKYRACVLARWQTEVAERQASGKIKPPGEYQIRDRAGHQRDVLVGFALQGALAIVTFQDVTQTRAAEAALEAERRQKEQTAYALTENMPAGAYTMVLRPGAEMGEFGFLSRQFLHMLEMTKEEAEGDPMRVFARVHPEDRPHWIEMNAKAFAGRLPFTGEARIVANGQTRWFRAESVPRNLADGSVIWEGLLVDIHAFKTAEQELQTVLEAARAYSWRRDIRAQRSEFDGHWAKLAGHPPGEHDMPSDSWFRTVHPEDMAKVRAEVTALENGTIERSILTYRRQIDDAWIWLQVHAGVSERDETGKPSALSGVSFNITAEMEARLKAQEDQAQLREDLQRAQQRDTVAQVAGGVAHDLNNLIAVVAGTTEMLEQRADDQPWLKDGLGRIQRSMTMARDLISGLGGLVRPDTQRETHDLGKLLHDAVDLLGQRRIKHHSVRLDLADDPMLIWANPTELAQVIVNLAINACDSGTQERPATVTLKIFPTGSALPKTPPHAGIAPQAGLPMAMFSVSDTGTGITPQVRARMFRPNYTTKGSAGTGLGLLIVSTILQSNNAALWVDSTAEKGTEITVAWPLAPRTQSMRLNDHDKAAWLSDPLALTDALADHRIMVVDDLIDVAEVLVDMLEAAGALALAVSDPEVAMKSLTEAPDLWSALVTDLHMPGMNGHALAAHANSLSPPVPTVLVTARADTLSEETTKDFSAVLPKPVTSLQLVRAVRQAADQNRHMGH
jgi:signal transduction histidine kinase/CheY-like chemotaxis protein